MGEQDSVLEERLRAVETGQAETRVYIKQIKEDIHDIKSSLKEIRSTPQLNENNAKVWQPIILELIKLAGLSITILGAIVGAVKILGK